MKTVASRRRRQRVESDRARIWLTLTIPVMTLLSAAPASAQSPNDDSIARHAQLFVSNGAKIRRLGGNRGMLHFGFGLEWRLPSRFGISIEAGPRFEDYEFGRFDDVMISVDGSYRFRSASKFTPVVGGGYALGWEPVPDGVNTSFVSVGGGATYGLDARREIRFELRDAITVNKPQTGYHYLGFRIGYSWRMGA